jgi:hypothetical protein
MGQVSSAHPVQPRFRGGIFLRLIDFSRRALFKADKLLYHSILGVRVMKKKIYNLGVIHSFFRALNGFEDCVAALERYENNTFM